MTGSPPDGWTPRPCPTCGKPSTYAERPFCSRRCRLVDLGRWFGGDYAIPAVEDDDTDEAVRDGEAED